MCFHRYPFSTSSSASSLVRIAPFYSVNCQKAELYSHALTTLSYLAPNNIFSPQDIPRKPMLMLRTEKFSPQMPVIHHATVNTNTDLPPPLLASIIIIGAIYSHVKHTRRFAIVLLDIVRWHLRIALECDNSLMRDPNIIYAEALICHTGLWNGNKRAFELAEVVRGALVTYIRRMRFGDKFTEKTQAKANVQAEWKHWIAEESQRRLVWVVYTIDSQFPSLLNLPPSISIGEVRNVGCPCDEEFWSATTARHWKNLLGPASVPPSRSFSAAVGPFLLVTSMPDLINNHFAGRLPALNLNPWSAFLVLISITHQIYQFSEESMIGQTFDHNEEEEFEGNLDDVTNGLRKVQELRRSQLAGQSQVRFLSNPIPQKQNCTAKFQGMWDI